MAPGEVGVLVYFSIDSLGFPLELVVNSLLVYWRLVRTFTLFFNVFLLDGASRTSDVNGTSGC
jgi:hypothetical protein